MIRKFISIWVLLSMVTELWCFFNGRKRPLVNRASQVALRDLEPVGTETFNICCKSAIRAVHNRAAACLAACGSIFENQFKAQVSIN
jgi:hypothetical protein